MHYARPIRLGVGGAIQSTTSNMGYVMDTVTGAESIQDLSVPDPDVVAAYAARTDFLQSLSPCEYLSICVLGTCDPGVQDVAIDLSGRVAALDVEVTNLDSTNWCIPAHYEGVPVEQELVQGAIPDES